MWGNLGEEYWLWSHETGVLRVSETASFAWTGTSTWGVSEVMERLSIAAKYTVVGVLFGCCFPLGATALDLVVQGRALTLTDSIAVQRMQPAPLDHRQCADHSRAFFRALWVAGATLTVLPALLFDVVRYAVHCRIRRYLQTGESGGGTDTRLQLR